jgi:hypothetical protein
VKALLALLLALPAAAQPSHLDDQGFAPQLVEIKGTVTTDGSSSTQPVSGPFLTNTQLRATPVAISGTVSVGNALLVTTVTAAVPIQRTQALLGRYYSVTTPSKLSSTAESPILLFVNLSTNTKTAFFDIGEGVSYDNNVTTVFRAYVMPTVTSSGTAISILPTNPLAGPSQMQAFLSPTVSSNGTAVFVISATSGRVVREFFQSRVFIPGIVFLITVEHSGNNKRSALTLDWAEEVL